MQSSLQYPISSSSFQITPFPVLTSYRRQKRSYFFSDSGALAGAAGAVSAFGAVAFLAAFFAFFGSSFFISLPAQGLAGAPVVAGAAAGFFISSAKLRPATETLKKAVITTIPNFFIIASNYPFPGFDIISSAEAQLLLLWCMSWGWRSHWCLYRRARSLPHPHLWLNPLGCLLHLLDISRLGRGRLLRSRHRGGHRLLLVSKAETSHGDAEEGSHHYNTQFLHHRFQSPPFWFRR